jgi:hypothetical protein
MGDSSVIFYVFKEEILCLKSPDKIKPQSPKEKLSRYLWTTIFAPDYSATGLAAKM